MRDANDKAFFGNLMDEINRNPGDVPRWKPKEGDNVLRILPGFPCNDGSGKRKPWVKTYKTVFEFGPNNRIVVPPFQFGDTDDPYKLWHDKLCQKQDPASQSEANRTQVQLSCAVFIIDRTNESAGPQLWFPSAKTMKRLTQLWMNDKLPGSFELPEPDADGRGAWDLKLTYTPKEKTATRRFAEYSVDPEEQRPLGTPEQTEEWLAEDLFEKYGIGKPTPKDWIQAIVDGKEDEYIRKLQERDQQQTTPQTSVQPPAPWEQSSSPAPSAPMSASSGVTIPPGVFLDDDWWIVDDSNSVVSVSVRKIAEMVVDGKDPLCMPPDRNGGWQTASVRGFKMQPTEPPPPPAGPPSSPPSPPTGPAAPDAQSGGNPADILQAELDALKAKQAQETQAATDIEAQLRA